MTGKLSLTPATPQPLSGTVAPPPTGMSVVDDILRFTGRRREFAALFLAAAFTSKMLRGGVVFTYNGPDRAPTLESALPPLAANQPPYWLDPVLKFLAEHGAVSHIQAFPPVKDTGVRSSRGELLVPLVPADNVYAAFEMADIHPGVLTALTQNLDFFASLWRFQHKKQTEDPADALAPAMGVLATVNRANRFQQFAMALCNEMASRFACDRVSLGFLKGRHVTLAAMSHTEKIGKGMDLVRAIEVAMEECLDQDAEALHPEPAGYTGISRAAAELARQFGSGSVISLPLHYQDKLIAGLTLERAAPEAPSAREVKQMRLIGELASPRLQELRLHDRWFGSRLARGFLASCGWFLGPRHVVAKLAALAVLAAGIWLSSATGDYRVDATFVTVPAEQRVVASPFDGFVLSSPVRPGGNVTEGETLMAELETSELRSQLAMRRAEQSSREKEAALARRDNKLAEEQVAMAQAEQAAAECVLLETKIAQARVFAPLTGAILSGDWTRKIGAPVKQGEALFEVAPLTRMEADLYVPEEDITDVGAGGTGELAAAGRPDEKIRFRIMRITPMAEMVKQKNVFRVQVELENPPEWLRPGLEGLAKIDVDRRLLVDIWTRRAVNWLRAYLWI